MCACHSQRVLPVCLALSRQTCLRAEQGTSVKTFLTLFAHLSLWGRYRLLAWFVDWFDSCLGLFLACINGCLAAGLHGWLPDLNSVLVSLAAWRVVRRLVTLTASERVRHLKSPKLTSPRLAGVKTHQEARPRLNNDMSNMSRSDVSPTTVLRLE